MPRSEPRAATRSPHPSVARAAVILVVEDHPDSAEVLAAILESWGYRVRVAAAVDAALALARTERPDLVVSDIGLPGRDGFDLAAAFAADPALASVPLVAATSFASADTNRAARRAGFVEVVGKPIDPLRLQAVVAGLVDRRR